MAKDMVLQSFKYLARTPQTILQLGKPNPIPQGDWDFALDAMTAMVEREFYVTFIDGSLQLHGITVLDTGIEKAKVKAEKKLEEIHGSSFTLIKAEENFECDDPRFGER